MNEKELKKLYESDDVATAFLDHMASRQRNQTETKVSRALDNLGSEGYDFSRGSIISLFRKLENIGCGQFIIGRHGWPSRLIWSVGSLTASKLASGETQEEQEINEDLEQVEGELLSHQFNLRPDLMITIQLPSDLTKKEADRLSLFMQSLPMEDYE